MKETKGIKQYTDKELNTLYDTFISKVKEYLAEDPRLDDILNMYSEQELGTNLVLAPASNYNWFHNAWSGGYMEHILNVCKCIKYMSTLYHKMGGVLNYTEEEMYFSALHHDLGKLGRKGEFYYIAEPSDWWIEKRGRLYNHNPELHKITVTDRAFITLNNYGIEMSSNEWLAIKTSDGMYEDTNEYYLKAHNPQHVLKSALPLILHWADHMSTRIEYDGWKKHNPNFFIS